MCPQIHEGGRDCPTEVVGFDQVLDEEPLLSLSIAFTHYQNAVIIMQLQMKEEKKPAVCSDGKACRLELSLCHTYQLRDISQQKNTWLRRLPADSSTSEYMQTTLKKASVF